MDSSDSSARQPGTRRTRRGDPQRSRAGNPDGSGGNARWWIAACEWPADDCDHESPNKKAVLCAACRRLQVPAL
eukprot:2123665-Alexandrium_andersonii.AAC.1